MKKILTRRFLMIFFITSLTSPALGQSKAGLVVKSTTAAPKSPTDGKIGLAPLTGIRLETKKIEETSDRVFLFFSIVAGQGQSLNLDSMVFTVFNDDKKLVDRATFMPGARPQIEWFVLADESRILTKDLGLSAAVVALRLGKEVLRWESPRGLEVEIFDETLMRAARFKIEIPTSGAASLSPSEVTPKKSITAPNK